MTRAQRLGPPGCMSLSLSLSSIPGPVSLSTKLSAQARRPAARLTNQPTDRPTDPTPKSQVNNKIPIINHHSHSHSYSVARTHPVIVIVIVSVTPAILHSRTCPRIKHAYAYAWSHQCSDGGTVSTNHSNIQHPTSNIQASNFKLQTSSSAP